jgi:dolichol-phosphate mannosyltransferase
MFSGLDLPFRLPSLSSPNLCRPSALAVHRVRPEPRSVLVFAPTYNEAKNIESLVREVFASLPQCDFLVVDDNSPDGSGEILERLKAEYGGLRVIHRPGKRGLGTAHKLAIKYAIAHTYDALFTMDADFSHDPKCLPSMLRELEHADFVIGSRYATGGTCEYPLSRLVLSRVANALTRAFLGIPLHETTTSYRGFRRSLLEQMNIDSIDADGYAYLFESVYEVSRLAHMGAGQIMVEFPICFADRRAGSSKISTNEISSALTTLTRLALRRVTRAHVPPQRTPSPGEAAPCAACGSPYRVEKAAGRIRGFIRAQSQRATQCLGCGEVLVDSPPHENTESSSGS